MSPLNRLIHFFAAIATAILLVSGDVETAAANPKYASIVIDANSGKVLHSRHANSPRYPASLTKMMTLYMLFEAMEQGKVRKDTRIVMSRHAASMQPSKLGIPAGRSISAEQAIYALVTKSANDVAAAVGEHLGGTESEFARMMTRKARALGMSKTTFRNASGLPNSRQLTTARDMATLGIALQEHFPKQFRYFSARNFKYGKAHFRNHNRLLGQVRGVDGIKTGYTRASGFNLVSSVNDRGRSIVAVVMGGKSGASRNAHMQKLLAANVAKGSKRKRGQLVARATGTQFSLPNLNVAALEADEIPIPTPAARTTTATADVAVSVTPQPARPAQRETVNIAVPRPPAPVDNLVTGSTKKRSGWVIQIGALPSENQAVDFLQTAQDKAASVLEDMEPFIERFEKGGTLYHRARFAGFSSKSEAWAACTALKKYKYSCLAYDNT